MRPLRRHLPPYLAVVAVLLMSTPTSVGEPAVPFTPADFTRSDLAGHPVHLRGLRGQVILLNFWATWCGPCLTELPVFASWQREEAQHGLKVIGVAMDDDPTPVRAAMNRLQLGVPVLMGDAALARSFGGVLGLPVTLLIDRQGRVRERFDGAANLETLHRDVLALLH